MLKTCCRILEEIFLTITTHWIPYFCEYDICNAFTVLDDLILFLVAFTDLKDAQKVESYFSALWFSCMNYTRLCSIIKSSFHHCMQQKKDKIKEIQVKDRIYKHVQQKIISFIPILLVTFYSDCLSDCWLFRHIWFR